MKIPNLSKDSKFGNTKVMVGDIQFDSKREADRFRTLKLLLDKGMIGHITVHPMFTLQEPFEDNGGEKHKGIYYEADFSYIDKSSGKTIIEDVKGFRTKEYRIKKKLFLKTLSPNTIFVEI